MWVLALDVVGERHRTCGCTHRVLGTHEQTGELRLCAMPSVGDDAEAAAGAVAAWVVVSMALRLERATELHSNRSQGP